MKTKYVVDTNVLVHWLLRPNELAGQIINSYTLELFTPIQALDELTDHKDTWLQKSPDISFTQFGGAIAQFIDIVVPPYNIEAEKTATALIGKIDPKDIPFLTLAIEKGADIWSYDRHFDNLPLVARLDSQQIRDKSFSELPELWAWLNRSSQTSQ